MSDITRRQFVEGVAGIAVASGIVGAMPKAAAAATRPRYFGGPGSVWACDVTGAPVDPDSAAMVADFAALWQSKGWWVSRDGYSNPHIYVVDDSVPLQPVYLRRAEGDTTYVEPDPGGDDWAKFAHTLRQGVPVPPGFQAGATWDSKTADFHGIITKPSTKQAWEFWHMWRDTDPYGTPIPGAPTGVYQPVWGGYIDNYETHAGTYYPGRQGATACSLSILGGLPTEEELKAGEIPHALQFQIPTGNGDVWPASRHDNYSGVIPQGQRLRLKGSFDPESVTFPTEQGQRTARMIARTVRTYGMIHNDHTQPGLQMRFEWPQDQASQYDFGGRPGQINYDMPAILAAAIPVDQLEAVDDAWRP